jgi:hypothetical protein
MKFILILTIGLLALNLKSQAYANFESHWTAFETSENHSDLTLFLRKCISQLEELPQLSDELIAQLKIAQLNTQKPELILSPSKIAQDLLAQVFLLEGDSTHATKVKKYMTISSLVEFADTWISYYHPIE